MPDVRWQPPKKPKYEQAFLILLGTLIAAALTVVYALLLRVGETMSNDDSW